eukprot:2463021-Rhodomonas_salina.1
MGSQSRLCVFRVEIWRALSGCVWRVCAAGHALKALRIQLGNNHTAVFRQEVQSVPENAVSPTVGSAAPVGGAGPDPLAGPAVRAGLRRLPLH